MNKTKNPLQILRNQVRKMQLSDNPKREKNVFNLKKFIIQSKEVKKTFKNEDLLQFKSGLNTG